MRSPDRASPRRLRPVVRGTIDPLLDARLRERADTEGRAISRIMEAALRLYLDTPGRAASDPPTP